MKLTCKLGYYIYRVIIKMSYFQKSKVHIREFLCMCRLTVFGNILICFVRVWKLYFLFILNVFIYSLFVYHFVNIRDFVRQFFASASRYFFCSTFCIHNRHVLYIAHIYEYCLSNHVICCFRIQMRPLVLLLSYVSTFPPLSSSLLKILTQSESESNK